MSLIATDGFKDLCVDVDEEQDDDPGEQNENKSVFNSLDFHDINGNTHQRENNDNIDDISEDKISTETEKGYNSAQFSLDVNLSQFDRSLASHVSLDCHVTVHSTHV